MIYPYGDKYIGEGEDGKKHGEGTETYSGGEFFVGKWIGISAGVANITITRQIQFPTLRMSNYNKRVIL